MLAPLTQSHLKPVEGLRIFVLGPSRKTAGLVKLGCRVNAALAIAALILIVTKHRLQIRIISFRFRAADEAHFFRFARAR